MPFIAMSMPKPGCRTSLDGNKWAQYEACVTLPGGGGMGTSITAHEVPSDGSDGGALANNINTNSINITNNNSASTNNYNITTNY